MVSLTLGRERQSELLILRTNLKQHYTITKANTTISNVLGSFVERIDSHLHVRKTPRQYRNQICNIISTDHSFEAMFDMREMLFGRLVCSLGSDGRTIETLLPRDERIIHEWPNYSHQRRSLRSQHAHRHLATLPRRSHAISSARKFKTRFNYHTTRTCTCPREREDPWPIACCVWGETGPSPDAETLRPCWRGSWNPRAWYRRWSSRIVCFHRDDLPNLCVIRFVTVWYYVCIAYGEMHT